MHRGSPVSLKLSLKLKILIPLISISFVVFILTFWIFHRYLVSTYETEIKKRAETIANTIIYLNDVSLDPNQIQCLVTTLNLDPDIRLIVTVAGSPPIVFASSRIQWLDKDISAIPNLPERAFLRASANSTKGFQFEKHLDDSFIYITSLKITRPKGNADMIGNGALLLEISVSSILQELSRTILVMASGLALSTIVIAVFIFLIIRRFVLKPATAMKNVMMNRAQGDLQERVPVYFHDEIGSIARSLNEMLDQLERESTKRSLVESRLRESESKLMELNSNKDKFFSIIAHDLKSPFNAILGFSKLLQDDYTTSSAEQHQFFIRRIVDGLSNVYKLLENLLDWSRIQLGRVEFHPESLDIGLMAYEILNINRLSLDKKGMQLTIEIPDNTIVYADENMLKTILRNLISNALKFSSSGTAIRIRTISSSESKKVPPGFVGVMVIDEGVGISSADINLLFKIDAGFHRKGTSNETGTGLGLVLCKEFVDAHGGEIWALSEDGKGSTFIFTIPLS